MSSNEHDYCLINSELKLSEISAFSEKYKNVRGFADFYSLNRSHSYSYILNLVVQVS